MVRQKYKIERLNYFSSGNRFINKTLSHKFYSKSRMFNCSFSKADIYDINFKGAIITSCSFKQASFKGVDFLGTNLKGCNFTKSSFEKVIFVGTKLKDCNFKNANFKNVTFVNTNLSTAKNLNISEGVEIINQYPKLILSNELRTVIDELKDNSHIFKTKVLHLPNSRYNLLNILLLLRKFPENELIALLRMAMGRVKKDICTYYSLERELRRLLVSAKI